MKDHLQTMNQTKKQDTIFCLVAAFIIITLSSKSSFLYPLNDWMDSNCYFTVGKAILSGLVPYKDILEQKGPYIYFMHALAALVDYDSFIFVWFLEVVAAWIFLIICRKIMLIYNEDSSIFAIAIIAAGVYGSKSFCHGDSCEEFALPILAYALWLGLSYIKKDKEITFAQGVMLGACMGFLFWFKYNLLGFILGCFIFYVYMCMRRKRMGHLIKTSGAATIGGVLLTIPVAVYFVVMHGVKAMFKVYFYENIFGYSVDEGTSPVAILSNLALGLQKAYTYSWLLMVMFVVAIVASVMLGNKKECAFLAVTFLVMFVAIYFGSFRTKYYSLPFGVYMPIAMVHVENFVRRKVAVRFPKANANACRTLVVVTAFAMFFTFTENIYLMAYSKDEMPQYKFAEIIAESGIENPTLLNYGWLDGGFYTAAGIVPNTRVFCLLNSNTDELKTVQNNYLNAGLVDFVVTRNNELNHESYTLISSTTFYIESATHTYRLYQKTVD